ncbi:aldehyde dehydrogenase family protein [Alteromonas sp. 1_MG-2023]|uniref:aldehyde dehydrogenase family protein n=1 Tax=Alteromonas sp. 1_MG-2023 TaxID=3062669 RepID=UPI0026E41B62|nr:aldehyde dehydrogenase family protein [Alteromonas sp. 1_MG-2023]MDO6476105.1 aldehyde dehydrogenase family protein [Alteromonas sp. 1_MG-2023]
MQVATSSLIQDLPVSQSYINGAWVDTQGTACVDVINPSGESVLTSVRMGSQQDVDSAVAAARAAFESWSETTAEQRLALLDGLLAQFDMMAESFARLISAEMGAPLTYARTAQVPLAKAHIQTARDNLQRYPLTQLRGTTAIVKEPIGVAALITPWNWPLYQITAKVAPALAAGCAVVLKPSELSPLSALAFAQAVHEAGFPAGVFNLVNGDGAVVGTALSEHNDVDMISITGSTRAGILVAQAAAKTVKRVAQELGGKSPNLLLPDADFNTAVPAGIAAGMRNCGQSCSAPTRMLVPRERLEEVEALAVATVNGFILDVADNEHATHGPLANKAQFDRVQTMIQKGLDEGARCIVGGTGKPDHLPTGYFARPTIFSDVTTNMAVAQEEIFGPVICLIPYDSLEEAVQIANDTVYGLGAHVQSQDLTLARKVARKIRSGQVHINYPAWDPQAPFGGYKQSGTGREYGVEGLEEYLETKAIVGYAQPE